MRSPSYHKKQQRDLCSPNSMTEADALSYSTIHEEWKRKSLKKEGNIIHDILWVQVSPAWEGLLGFPEQEECNGAFWQWHLLTMASWSTKQGCLGHTTVPDIGKTIRSCFVSILDWKTEQVPSFIYDMLIITIAQTCLHNQITNALSAIKDFIQLYFKFSLRIHLDIS